LAIIPWFFGFEDPGLAFDVALHLGTLFSLLIYYWRTWLGLSVGLATGKPDQWRLFALLMIASVPGAVFGLLFEKQAETVFRSPLVIAAAMTAMGIALWLVDRWMPQRRTLSEITYLDALAMGVSQAFALIPGVSRSGVTITTGRGIALNRADAANFSFLMATPIIAGAGLLKARELIHAGLTPALIGGFLASAIFGWLAISILIQFVRTRSYEAFVWYRIVFAAVVVVVYFARV
jgi:undecaprenyl-diphosphatase